MIGRAGRGWGYLVGGALMPGNFVDWVHSRRGFKAARARASLALNDLFARRRVHWNDEDERDALLDIAAALAMPSVVKATGSKDDVIAKMMQVFQQRLRWGFPHDPLYIVAQLNDMAFPKEKLGFFASDRESIITPDVIAKYKYGRYHYVMEKAAAAYRATAAAWPSEKYDNSPERGSRKQQNILAFLRRVWKPFIEENNVLVTRQVLERQDPDAWRALKSYFRSSGNTLPPDIPILKSSEARDVIAERPTAPAPKPFDNGIPDPRL
jgi:hypothetical protein